MKLGYVLEEGAGDGTGGAAAGGDAGTGGGGPGTNSQGDGAGGALPGNVGGAQAPWHGIADAEGAAYVTNKGWTSVNDVIQSYQGAEKLIGRDPNTLLVMPRADDPDGLRAVHSKLGMPETADKYEFGTPAEGELPVNEEYATWARGAFHKAGLSSAQAKALFADNNEYMKGVHARGEEEYALSLQTDKATLLQEWGGGHERMMNAANTAAKNLGFTGDMIDAMETAVGYADTMKFFAKLGQKLGEDGFVSGDGGRQPGFDGALTPDEAKQQWETMKIDPAAVAALQNIDHPGHKAAKEKQTRLFAIMYPQPS